MKWEPVALMALLLALAVWLVAKPAPEPEVAQGHTLTELRIATEKVWLETWTARTTDDQIAPPVTLHRVRRAGEEPTPPLTSAELARVIGPEAVAAISAGEVNWLFRLLNITTWISLVWVGLGLVGQVAFFGRMLVQWIVSERKRESVIPDAFWYLSFAGGVLLFTYFVWRQDIVGVLGQTTGVVIYGRNIRLIWKKRKRAEREASQEPTNQADA